MKKDKKKMAQKLAAVELAALAASDANTLVIGIDLGDRTSNYWIRTRDDQQIVMEGTAPTTLPGMAKTFESFQRQRFVMETGTHSRWVSGLLELLGYEVVVGNARKLKLITENAQKSDKVDARLLSQLGCMGMEWLHPVRHRSQAAHMDLSVIHARERLVEARTALINFVRGTVKAFGCRVEKCSSSAFVQRASEAIPEAMKPAMEGVLRALATIQEEIAEYDSKIDAMCSEKYMETRWLTQVAGVGNLTALTFVLTIEDPARFENSRAVGAFLGLTPKKRQSGQRDPKLGISKAGDELLRKLLVNCAHHILGVHGKESDLRQWGLRVMGQPKGKQEHGAGRKVATTAVARKLAVLLHRLWVKEAVYVPLQAAVKGVAA